jgi:hypothetical protein
MAWKDDEAQRREQMWADLLDEGGPHRVAPGFLNSERIYVPARGVWTDFDNTRVPEEPTGAAVSLLHTGKHYADELTADGVIYHYPRTLRAGRDASEIAAIATTARLRLPLFVVTHTPGAGHLRDVYRGYIEGVDDEAGLVLVLFTLTPPAQLIEPTPPEAPFNLFDSTPRGRRTVTARRGQQQFKFAVFRQYGPGCAMCDYGVVEALDAVHIVEDRDRGSRDPRNGLVLCAVHHRLFDADLVAIEPGTLALHFRPQGPAAEKARIPRTDLSHLRTVPHPDAIAWRWDKWLKATEMAPGGPVAESVDK